MIPNLPALPLTEADWLFAVLMSLVLVVPLLAERVHVPAIVGLVLAGALVGPGGLGLVAREGAVGTLGTIGLLYLMFLAGVELDLEEFAARRRDSAIFGVLTFAFPMALGFGSSLLLGFGTLASVLLASCWASHTLLSYPVFRRYGTIANRSVSTSVGGTIITDTAALLVLVVVASAFQGELSAVFWLSLAAGIAAVGVVTLWVLPRIGRWFFARFAHEGGIRFVFVLAALFAASALAHLGGLEPIIGAFLTGLGLNRLVPNGSRLMERIEFVGSNLLIPLFLLSVGLLIDVRLLTDPRTLLLAVVFASVAIVAKAAAAEVSGRVFGYTRAEVGAMVSLSMAQAAATLAAVVVGLRIGLLDTDVVNAVVVVILATCLLSSSIAGRIAPRLVPPAPRRALGTVVVLPVVRPESAVGLARLGAAIAQADAGVVVPVTVAVGDHGIAALDELRTVNARVEQMAREHGVETRGVVRLDASPAAGVLHSVIEQQASVLLMGWHGPDHAAMFTTVTAPILAESPAPVLLARLEAASPARVVVVVPHADTTVGGQANLRLALDVGRRLGLLHRCAVVALACVATPAVLATVDQTLGEPAEVDARAAATVVRERTASDDLVVFPVRGGDTHLRGVDRLYRATPASQAVAAIGGAPPPRPPKSGRRHHAEVPLAPRT
ncbi:MAG: cation:proton antiporter [Egibacteraceae bacterium]